jgi:hypothetical protein
MALVKVIPRVVGLPVVYVPEFHDNGEEVDMASAVLTVESDATQTAALRDVDIDLSEPIGNGLDGLGGRPLVSISLRPAVAVRVALELLRLADPDLYDIEACEPEARPHATRGDAGT